MNGEYERGIESESIENIMQRREDIDNMLADVNLIYWLLELFSKRN